MSSIMICSGQGYFTITRCHLCKFLLETAYITLQRLPLSRHARVTAGAGAHSFYGLSWPTYHIGPRRFLARKSRYLGLFPSYARPRFCTGHCYSRFSLRPLPLVSHMLSFATVRPDGCVALFSGVAPYVSASARSYPRGRCIVQRFLVEPCYCAAIYSPSRVSLPPLPSHHL